MDQTSFDEVKAFESATRDLVGLALRSVEGVDVTLPQFRLLLTLDELGPSSSTACAQALGVAGSSITRLAQRLENMGRLARATDPANRSVVVLSLTDEGRAVVRRVGENRRRELTQVLGELDPQTRRDCAAGLEALHRLLGPSPRDPRSRLPL